MKKWIIGAVVVLAIIGAGAYVVMERLDIVVKVALEYFGPGVTGTEVRVGDVAISPRSGRGRLRNLEIANPQGFSVARAARFNDVILEVDPATLRSPIVHVTAIGIDAPAILYERGAKTTNLEVIARNMEAYAKRSEEEAAGWSSGVAAKRKFIIDRLLIRGGKVTMTSAALRGQGVTFDLPDIELRDIGKRQGGVTASQAGSIVANAIVARIAQRVLSNIDLLRKGGLEGAIDALKGLVR
jgi:hypothetical protein